MILGMTTLFFHRFGFGHFGLGGALGGGVGGGVAEAQQEGFDIHALLAGQLQVRDGDGAVFGGDGQVRFAVAQHRTGSGMQVCPDFSKVDF